MIAIDPDILDSMGPFLETLVRIGVEEGPTIVDMIRKAFAGEDPLAALAAERVEQILPELQLEVAMRAERMRITALEKTQKLPVMTHGE